MPGEREADRTAREAEREAREAERPAREAQTRRITLHHAEHTDSTIYRMQKGYTVQFYPGPSLLGRKVFLYINYPVENDEGLAESARGVEEGGRNQYYALAWRRGGDAGGDGGERDGGERDGGERDGGEGAGALVDSLDLRCELRVWRPGPYHYYYVYDNPGSGLGPAGSGWLQVAPGLAGGRVPDAVCCLTVLTKCLGPLPRWLSVLRVAREAGYNMVHFTPIQELGGSDSSYSIQDQLRLDPRYGCDGREPTFADVENIVTKMREDWSMLSICDVVLNHTANESPWLAEHPEAAYNCLQCPHLRPAALLDAALARLPRAPGMPAALGTEPELQQLQPVLRAALQELRLHEMFQADVPRIVHDFYTRAKDKVPGGASGKSSAEGGEHDKEKAAPDTTEELRLLEDPQRRRLHATVDMDLALQLYNVYRVECYDEESRLRRCGEALRERLEALNAAARATVDEHLAAAERNVLAAVRYFRIQEDGPKIKEINDKNPLVPRYFTFGFDPARTGPAAAEEAVMGAGGAAVMAHNGWVMDADPLEDFAARDAGGRVYLRRELLAWGDSVKLRYGAGPRDCPALWRRMQDYVELTAELFDGLRLDNCHSTPLHVAEYMLDAARAVKPDLYVVAELFTNSDHVDNIFLNRLGITCLIREAASAWDCRELGRLVHRFGGRPVGAFLQGPARDARARVAPALLLDLTHDNPSAVGTRGAPHALAAAALVAAACGAAGSTRGHDELVPHHIHVVDERRLYAAWGEPAQDGHVDLSCGMLAAKRELNLLHQQLATDGYCEVYVDQIDDDVVAVTRHNPRTRESIVVVTHAAFRAPAPGARARDVALRLDGDVEPLLELSLRHRLQSEGRPYAPPAPHEPHAKYITGLRDYECGVRARPAPGGMLQAGADGRLRLRLAPADVLVLRVRPAPAAAAALAALAAPAPPAAALAPADLSALLFRCDAEERDATGGQGGVYDVPGHGPLVYAGLQGALSLLDEVRAADALGHPLCDNLRAGTWLPDYVWQRAAREPRLAAWAAGARELLRRLDALPAFLRPAYFDRVLRALHAGAVRAALAGARGDRTRRALVLVAAQLAGAVPSAALPPPGSGPALSAGLPHFAVGYMRCWGRDTFISLRGMFLLTERYAQAREHILGFAACLRHGLIPNLLDSGRPRYNCRDAVWWWLHSIRQYVTEAPGGPALLGDRVSRVFPSDDCEPAPPGAADQPLHDVMQEALDKHFQGLVFRERNAGRGIDAHMTDKGFNVQIGIDPETGFPFGGNDANCGTWMDKMGSSERAGTRGRPATPRDGSAVELVALAHSAAEWLHAQHAAGRYPHAGLTRAHRDGRRTHWPWADWAARIRRNFERHFWVPAEPSAADARPDLVHRRAIYKDSHGASQPWADYQLRCNFPVAMAVAPALFDPRHAWLALDNVERLLLGPLGVKTLDPADWAYRPDYDNANDSDDPAVAHGFNYHQGPEWVWPIGFYVRARLAFAVENDQLVRTVAAGYAALAAHAAELERSPWRGLPELTNAGGAPCAGSCPTQAWSAATVLEALHALQAARRARPLPAA